MIPTAYRSSRAGNARNTRCMGFDPEKIVDNSIRPRRSPFVPPSVDQVISHLVRKGPVARMVK